MKKCIVYTVDNELQICYPLNVDDIEHVLANDIPKTAKNVNVIDSKELPNDRYFRDAWEYKGKKVQINKEKALKIKLDKLAYSEEKKANELDKVNKMDYIKNKHQNELELLNDDFDAIKNY